jgi:hypothetical protein
MTDLLGLDELDGLNGLVILIIRVFIDIGNYCLLPNAAADSLKGAPRKRASWPWRSAAKKSFLATKIKSLSGSGITSP